MTALLKALNHLVWKFVDHDSGSTLSNVAVWMMAELRAAGINVTWDPQRAEFKIGHPEETMSQGEDRLRQLLADVESAISHAKEKRGLAPNMQRAQERLDLMRLALQTVRFHADRL